MKVFKLNDCDWWAGETLQSCIAEARKQFGADSYPNAEADAHELSPEEMRKLLIQRFEDCREKPVTFEKHLAELADCKTERFPQLFASTEI